MKRFVLIGGFLILAVSLRAGELRIAARADWMLTLRSGVEYRINRVVGVQADLGTNLQLIAADTGVVLYILDDSSPWRLNVVLGIPNAAMTLQSPAGMLSFGGSAVLGYRLKKNITVDVRIGAGYPLFFEWDRELTRDTAFPLKVWPDFAIVIGFPTGRTDE